MYFQFLFIVDRVKALAPQHPEWKTKEPFASILKGDLKTAAAGGEHAIVELMHVIDVVPTILEACRLRPPTEVDGIKQSPIEGVSFAYTFDTKTAGAPSTHKTQYFEMMGDHSIYHAGTLL